MAGEPWLAFLGGIGAGELLVIGMVALLIFGRRLPEVARAMGKSVTEFRRGLSDVQDEMRRAADAEVRALPAPPAASPVPPAPVAQPGTPAPPA